MSNAATTSEILTPNAVRAEVERIRGMAVADNDDDAHSAEDALHLKVLEAIANGTCHDSQKCAQVAMLTKFIEFSRWVA